MVQVFPKLLIQIHYIKHCSISEELVNFLTKVLEFMKNGRLQL